MSSELQSNIKFTPSRRKAFGDLVTVLRKLGVTKYTHLPVVSNPWNIENVEALMREYDWATRYYKKKV